LHSFQPDGYFSQWKNISDVGSRVRIDVARQQLYSQALPRPHSSETTRQSYLSMLHRTTCFTPTLHRKHILLHCSMGQTTGLTPKPH
jgi:hypothetical protein